MSASAAPAKIILFMNPPPLSDPELMVWPFLWAEQACGPPSEASWTRFGVELERVGDNGVS